MRTVARILQAHRQLEGAGFEVRRPFPGAQLAALGPFILFDQIGPSFTPPNAPGAPTHPHAGMETLTYLLAGRGMHLDSLGNASEMGPGEVQWMRAGRGIVHDEGPADSIRRDGGDMHGVQIWINLPRGYKDSAPEYRHFTTADIPLLNPADGVEAHLIAGVWDDSKGPLETFAAPWIAHLRLAAGAQVTLNPIGEQSGVYVLNGAVDVAGQKGVLDGRLVIFADAEGPISLQAGGEGADIIALAGPPLDNSIARYGPFVADDAPTMHKVIERYQRGEFGEIKR